jgi:hypothetical protein
MSDVRWRKSPDRSLELDDQQLVKRQPNGLLEYVDRNETERFQTKERLPHPTIKPAWRGEREAFQQQVLDRPYNQAKRQWWCAILYRYYSLNYTARQIAEEFGITRKSITRVIERLNATFDQNGDKTKDI